MDFSQLPQIQSALQHPHTILIDNEDVMLIHCTVSNVFVAECHTSLEKKFVEEILKHNPVRLQTSNPVLQQLLLPYFKHSYKCDQAVFSDSSKVIPDSRLCLLKKDDLFFAANSYGMADYINQLYIRNRIFGYYDENQLIGYVAFHIDETVGALYVKPEFRNHGYGKKIMSSAAALYKDKNPDCICFSQILADNINSIKLHKKLDCIFTSPVYWVYNEEYSY